MRKRENGGNLLTFLPLIELQSSNIYESEPHSRITKYVADRNAQIFMIGKVLDRVSKINKYFSPNFLIYIIFYLGIGTDENIMNNRMKL
jgi:hypothetical protein